jgi:Alpha/beta hydrolase domain
MIARRSLLLVVALTACSSSTTAPSTTAPSTTAPVLATAATTTTTSVAPTVSTVVASTATTNPPATTSVQRTTVPPRVPKAGAVTVSSPANAGKGAVVLGVGQPDLSATGYTQSEYFVAGTASAYTSATPLGSDGKWTVTPSSSEPYTTRIVVRRPSAARFNGNVAVEWLNVTAGFDNGIDWTYSHVELIRAGWAWVGVSAQSVGVEGGGNALGAALALKTADPDRYGSLRHPGDNYSYDIFSQVGAAVRTHSAELLGDLAPKRVFAIGESQSAFRLSTYVNAIAPIANVFDAYLLHSRGSAGAALAQEPLTAVPAPNPTLVRDDVGAPVLTFITETDLVDRLNFVKARQPDTPNRRTWEVAGTAHADSYSLSIGDSDDGSGTGDAAFFAQLTNPPTTVYGGVITCDRPLNAGPHTYVLRSAIRALDAWVRTGTPPPSTPLMELSGDTFVLDAVGNVKGGIRTPHVDAPIAILSGLGQTGATFCFLFGTTTPLPQRDPDFVVKWNKATDDAVATGAILQADAVNLKSAAAA